MVPQLNPGLQIRPHKTTQDGVEIVAALGAHLYRISAMTPRATRKDSREVLCKPDYTVAGAMAVRWRAADFSVASLC